MSKSVSKHQNRLRLSRLSKLIAAASYIALITTLVLMLSRFAGMDIAFFIALTLSILVTVNHILQLLRINEKYSKPALIIQRCFLVCIIIGFVVFFVLQVLILTEAHTDDVEVSCVIILGAGLYGDVPSLMLTSRLDMALDYLDSKADIPIIISGGQGPGESITEAEAMFRYLKYRGIDENRLWKEDKSTSTLENLTFSFDLMKTRGIDAETVTIAIVTNEFHLYRSKHISGKLGVNAIGVAAKTPRMSLRILYQCRESIALLKDFL